MAVDALRDRYAAAGQDHVFKWMDEGKLNDEETAQLKAQLESFDLDRIKHLFTDTMAASAAGISVESMSRIDGTENLGKCTPDAIAAWRTRGLQAIADGEVGVILLAGGQGTRLGFDKPKGMYDIGLPSHDSLFALQGKQIQRLRKLAADVGGKAPDAVSLPWYVMTSPMTDADTRAAFEANGFYGCNPDDVVFFSQGTLPCLTTDGKIIMESGCKAATAPDGNGGIYLALQTSGVLDNMESRGIKYVPQYCVDNACCKVADPVLVGFCISKGADVGGKALAKAAWNEKVGVFCNVDSKFSVVEYSDISEEAAKLEDGAGNLVFSSSHVCMNYYTVAYFKAIMSRLPSVYHVAHKKIPFADDAGATQKPDANNGIKLESFIMDVFPLAENPTVLECASRFGEFAPVKNAPGSSSDSPDQARQMASDEGKKWLEAAGATVEGDGLVAVSPLATYSGEGLEAVAGQTLRTPCIVAPNPGGAGFAVAGDADADGVTTYYV